MQFVKLSLKLHCDTRFQRAFTACVCFFKVITLVWANQRNYFENVTAWTKRTLKTTVATQLKGTFQRFIVQMFRKFFFSCLLCTNYKKIDATGISLDL